MTLTCQGHVTSSVRLHDDSITHRPFPICFFGQFFGKTHRLATIHTLQTDDKQTTDRQTHTTLLYKRDR